MANGTAIGTTLQIQTQNGTKASGEPKISNHNFPNVSASASSDDVLAVGQALAALIGEPLVQIVRVDQTALTTSTAPESTATASTAGASAAPASSGTSA
ncbi:DUF1659 domain-containing protein [Alicyclobacillus acidiphilus]|uniref:DUF1659 domain-containing protein n=1 Tax=Alicyclobacillus acidiphilus TaxID=182455 RepID=UPI00082D19EF|nr:DUF1659 domain-containing protein [Alicyclobacillus acidiphilus]